MKPEYSCFSIYNYGQIIKNAFFMLVLICVSVGIISSCSSDEEVAATATTPSAAITGETMTVGSRNYTS
jgi:hypothetical protein